MWLEISSSCTFIIQKKYPIKMQFVNLISKFESSWNPDSGNTLDILFWQLCIHPWPFDLFLPQVLPTEADHRVQQGWALCPRLASDSVHSTAGVKWEQRKPSWSSPGRGKTHNQAMQYGACVRLAKVSWWTSWRHFHPT
jgi:hypothetical protein